ncbi:unnamed protein product, partial [Closterium sp. NIES-53]
TDDTQRMMAMQMGGVGADPTKVLSAEKEALELTQPMDMLRLSAIRDNAGEFRE